MRTKFEYFGEDKTLPKDERVREVWITITEKNKDKLEKTIDLMYERIENEGFEFHRCPTVTATSYSDAVQVYDKEEADELKEIYKEFKKTLKNI